ncbi:MAG: hypothetical protein K0S88_875, partial [Actinomycetia bacterium]|nr:hypothetical protein [Actinomycetes bacterium]
MSQTPRRLLIVTAGAVVAAWAVLYLVVITTAPLSYDPATESAAKVNREFALLLAVPTALWVTAALTVVEQWWSRTGVRLSAMDPPGRLLAAAVATLPDHRREWGMAMHAELAEVQGRSARWQFALSSARAALRLAPLGGWPALALVTGVVAAAVVAAGPAVEAAVPGLGVFAVSFVGLVGAMVVLAVARSRRMRLPVPAPTLLVTGGVAAAITMTVIFLLRDPAAARYLPPANAVFLAAVLAGCLWIAVAAPRSLSSNRLAPHLGVAAAVVLVVGQLLLMRAASYEPRIESQGQQLVDLLAALWFWFGPVAVFFVPAFAAGSAGRSFRAGLQAGIWAGIAALPLTYALWLHEALRLYAINGGLLWSGDGAPEGENLSAALFWTLRFAP